MGAVASGAAGALAVAVTAGCSSSPATPAPVVTKTVTVTITAPEASPSPPGTPTAAPGEPGTPATGDSTPGASVSQGVLLPTRGSASCYIWLPASSPDAMSEEGPALAIADTGSCSQWISWLSYRFPSTGYADWTVSAATDVNPVPYADAIYEGEFLGSPDGQTIGIWDDEDVYNALVADGWTKESAHQPGGP